ncbi:hypothetical protein WUBG_11188 [Wuchereria bancrofti]|uniref:Uncharacterized protein n=1 Tax=Wuchereria bancrofti TaxID=6293 RepID=J9E6W8_WUCBA|nr:hypothetical protein WUBG_11188 [Wuchereria bancrofti]
MTLTTMISSKLNIIGDIEMIMCLILSPAQEIHSDDELKQIKAGKLELFDEIKSAITVGIFDDRNAEITAFLCHSNTIYTIRVLEKRKRIDFTGIYEIQELTNFVVRSSLPTVIDISNGFTSDILTHQMQPLILFIDNGNGVEKLKFTKLCAKSPYIICTTIILNSSKSKIVNEMINSLQSNDDSKRLIIFLREKIYALDIKNSLESGDLLQLIALATINKPTSLNLNV